MKKIVAILAVLMVLMPSMAMAQTPFDSQYGNPTTPSPQVSSESYEVLPATGGIDWPQGLLAGAAIVLAVTVLIRR